MKYDQFAKLGKFIIFSGKVFNIIATNIGSMSKQTFQQNYRTGLRLRSCCCCFENNEPTHVFIGYVKYFIYHIPVVLYCSP